MLQIINKAFSIFGLIHRYLSNVDLKCRKYWFI